MKTVLFTGMRRGELFKLKWSDLDFERGFISIVGPKGGRDQTIPMNESAREVLLGHVRTGSDTFSLDVVAAEEPTSKSRSTG